MRMKLISLIAFGLVAASATHAQTTVYRLQSALRTNYGAGSTTSLYTWYTYDNDGNRVETTTYDGADTTAAEMSSTEYAYDADGHLVREALMVGNDTIASVEYTNNADGNPVRIVTLNGAGAVRFSDSLVYDGDGNRVEKLRIDKNGDVTFLHRYTYDGDGNRATDTLFEVSGADTNATQAVLFSYDTDGNVTSEANYRESGGWFLISTVMMTYEQGDLVAATEYEGDGSSGRMMDSLAFEVDGNGNRIKESSYDDERTLVYTIDYTYDALTGTVVAAPAVPTSDLRVDCRDGRLRIAAANATPVRIALFDMHGRLISRRTVHAHGGDVSIQAAAGSGRFVARVAAGTQRATVVFAAAQ